MNKRLLLATTAVLALATSALAQTSPSTSSSPSTQRQPESSSAQTPSGSAQSTTPGSSAQSQAPASGSQKGAQATSPNTGTSQPSSGTSANQAQTSPPSGQSGTNPQSSQSQTGSSSSQAQTNSPSTSQTGTQAQGTGSTTTAQQPQQGTGATNTAQQPQQGTGSTNTAQQPSQNNTANSSTSVNASVNINDQQRVRISESVSRLNVQPLTSVNFSLSVGTVVPADVRLQPLPAEVVEVVPQYRGYDFVLVKDELVIVEPSTKKIVTVLPYSGRSTAAAPARTEQRKVTFSDRDREVVRKHVKAHPVERHTTGSSVRTEIRRGERLPEGVDVEVFPEEVYREAPTLREYRYINRDSRTYIVEPHDRRIIEEID